MSDSISDFFAVTVSGDVTVIQLLDAAGYRGKKSKDLDLAPMLHRLRGLAPPAVGPIWKQFRDDLLAYLAANQPRKVVLNFAGLERIGNQHVISTPMNDAFVRAKLLSDTFGCQWRICGLTKHTRPTYDISSLHMIFPQVHDAESDAIAAFS